MDPKSSAVELSEGVSINDLRKNLPLLNQYMEEQCRSTTGRYGIELDAALITEIDPPREVDRALSAINSTRNQVAADISTARADAEQQITMSARAVEIASNNAQAEVAPLRELADTLSAIKTEGRIGMLASLHSQLASSPVSPCRAGHSNAIQQRTHRRASIMLTFLHSLPACLRSRSCWDSLDFLDFTRAFKSARPRCSRCSARSSVRWTKRVCSSRSRISAPRRC